MGAPSDGLGVQLSESESIAVVITHWESVVSSAYYVALLDDLASGMPAGEAVQRHNRADRCAETGNRLCLVGDPAFRFQMQTRSERSDVPLDIGASARSSLRDLAGAVSFLRSFSSALITSDHPVYHDNSATFEDSMC